MHGFAPQMPVTVWTRSGQIQEVRTQSVLHGRVKKSPAWAVVTCCFPVVVVGRWNRKQSQVLNQASHCGMELSQVLGCSARYLYGTIFEEHL